MSKCQSYIECKKGAKVQRHKGTEILEQKLDSFDAAERREALKKLCEMVVAGDISLPEPAERVNMHSHTFFSYNSYGYSPSKFAWLARKEGLTVAAVVDFDVLDALEEFLSAAGLIGLRACVNLETRVFVPEFADKVINSPGEPGISYHMGVGFTNSQFVGEQEKFLQSLKQTAQSRNKDLIGRVNNYLSPVEVDYEKDVLALTPAGNVTERHICLAYARKAEKIFSDDGKLRDFWVSKLGDEARATELPQSRELLNLLRAKTMKRDGIGYVQPEPKLFPQMRQMNEFCLAAGAIPTCAWLDGTTDGEEEIEKLLEIETASGVEAINIIPDRNYTAGVKDRKLQNLYDVVELAQKLDLPICVGTEMNSPGQKFVDSFETEELKPLVPVFLRGAYIFYGHSVLQRTCGLGYTSDWSRDNFSSRAEKNDFFERLGKSIAPGSENKLADFGKEAKPDDILVV